VLAHEIHNDAQENTWSRPVKGPVPRITMPAHERTGSGDAPRLSASSGQRVQGALSPGKRHLEVAVA